MATRCTYSTSRRPNEVAPLSREGCYLLKAVGNTSSGSPPLAAPRANFSELRLERLYEKPSNTGEPPRHEANHRSVHQCFPTCTQLLVVFAHPPLLLDPSDRPLDGLLANDKFCMIRHARLSLGHSRRPNLTHRQTDVATAGSAYPPAGITRHGGDDETSVAPTSGSDGTPGREATLGSGVPGHPAVESRKRASSRSGRKRERERQGGVP